MENEMKYPNAKSGLNKLFTAELLTIVSGLSVAFNGETVKVIGVLLGLLAVVAFVINLIGLKQCAKDDVGYMKAYKVAIAGLLVCLACTLVGAFGSNSAVGRAADEIQIVFTYLVAWMVLKTTAPLLRDCGKEAEAVYADKVRKLYTAAFIVSEVLRILVDFMTGDIMIAVVAIVAIVALVVLLAAQIKYIIFLRRSANAL